MSPGATATRNIRAIRLSPDLLDDQQPVTIDWCRDIRDAVIRVKKSGRQRALDSRDLQEQPRDHLVR
jgi:hypothetical protein